jgi:AP-2 complex subunit alpha
LDSELQQRACEYLAIASRPDEDELLQNVCEEMPPFPPRESALLSRLHAKHGDTEDKRTWVIGGKEVNDVRELQRHKTLKKSNTVDSVNGSTEPTSPTAANGENGAAVGDDIMSSLAGLDLSSQPSLKPSISSSLLTPPSPITAKPPSAAATYISNPNVDRWFEKLTYTNEGVLYEDVQIQIGVKSEFHGHIGKVGLYFGNKMSSPLTSFTATVDGVDSESLSLSFDKIPDHNVPPKVQANQILHVECRGVFTTPPVLQISFVAGVLQTLRLRLPIVLTKFIEPVQLGRDDFFERWRLIGTGGLEAQKIVPIKLDPSGAIDGVKQKKVARGSGLAVLEGIDKNADSIVAAGVLHMSTSGKVGCMVRVEPNVTAKVRRQFV